MKKFVICLGLLVFGFFALIAYKMPQPQQGPMTPEQKAYNDCENMMAMNTQPSALEIINRSNREYESGLKFCRDHASVLKYSGKN
jgi:hypothetical protein